MYVITEKAKKLNIQRIRLMRARAPKGPVEGVMCSLPSSPY